MFMPSMITRNPHIAAPMPIPVKPFSATAITTLLRALIRALLKALLRALLRAYKPAKTSTEGRQMIGEGPRVDCKIVSTVVIQPLVCHRTCVR